MFVNILNRKNCLNKELLKAKVVFTDVYADFYPLQRTLFLVSARSIRLLFFLNLMFAKQGSKI